MSTAIRFYRSTQVNAPSLSGTAGDLISVLDACLVNGLAALAVGTLTQSGGVATATVSTGHGVEAPDVVQIQGANEAAYNVTARVSGVGAASISFPVDAGAPGTATGTITLRVPPAGWIKAHAGSNKAAYANAAATALYRCRDDAPNASLGARMAHWWMYESMSDVDTGSGGMATVGRTVSMLKSSAASSTPRPWLILASDRFAWLLLDWSGENRWTMYGLGDFPSFKSPDPHRAILIGGNSPAQATAPSASNFDVWTRALPPFGFIGDSTENFGIEVLRNSAAASAVSCLARMFSGFLYFSVASAWANSLPGGSGSGDIGATNPADGGVYIDRILIAEGGSPQALRGIAPGRYVVLNNLGAGFSSRGWELINCAFGPGDDRLCLVYWPLISGLPTNRAFALDVVGPWE